AVKDKLPTLITSADQLTTVLRVLNKEQRTIVYEAVKDELPKLIADAEQLATVLWYLEDKKRRSLLVDAVASTNHLGVRLQEMLEKNAFKDLSRIYVFRQTLNQLDKKREALEKEDASDRESAASRLYQGVNTAFIQYLQSDQKADAYNRFNKESTRLIDEAKESALKDHRGWRRLLANLLIGVLSLGTAFIANTIYTRGKHTLFEVNTDSVNKINEMRDALKSIKDDEQPENFSPGGGGAGGLVKL
ncbi:MAG: hypothetical protein ACRC0B_00255, partial [Legionella sp.]